MNFQRLVDQPDLFQATGVASWLPGQALTLFIEVESGAPSPSQLGLARQLLAHDSDLVAPLEQALFDYLRWSHVAACPSAPNGVWSLLQKPQAWFDWRCDDEPPTFQLSWSPAFDPDHSIAVQLTPWRVLGIGDFGASSLTPLAFIRAHLEPAADPTWEQCPLGRKTCPACGEVSFVVSATCPSCGAPRWWA